MSTRLPKAASSALSFQSRVFQNDKSSPNSGPCTAIPNDLSVAPRSALCISDVHKFSAAVYSTPKPRGRSAISRLSRSPYFKVSEYTSSQLVPVSTSNSDCRQDLKRGRSFLDNEDGFFRPIRRIRQKSGLISDALDTRFKPSSSSHSTLLHLDKDDLTDPTSREKYRSLTGLKNASTGLQNAVMGDSKILSSCLPPIPRQSAEACRKIMEQLDKVPSHEVNSSSKNVTMDASPSKLSAEMLNGQARRSLNSVGTFNFTGMDTIGTSDYINKGELQKNGGSQSEKRGKALENDPMRVDIPRVKFDTVANGLSKQAIFSKASTIPSISSKAAANPVPATVIVQRKPAFQMTAPEDFLELDDEQDAGNVSVQSDLTDKTDANIAETKASGFGMSAAENPLLPSSNDLNGPSSVTSPEISKKAYEVSQPSENESTFRFPTSTESACNSVQAHTPTMPLVSDHKLQNFGTPLLSSSTAVANESRIEPKPDSCWLGQKNHLEGSSPFNDGKSEALLHKSPVIVASSTLSALGTTDAIAFGTSTTSTQSNGILHSSSLPSSSSTLEAMPNSPASLFSSNSKLTVTSSSCPPVSTTLPKFSSSTTFNFGAAAEPVAPVSVSLSSDNSLIVPSEGQVLDKFPFGSSNPPTTQVASTSVSAESSTSLGGSSLFSRSGSVHPATNSTPATNYTPATNSTSATNSLFSQVSSSGPGFAAPSSSSVQTSGLSFSPAISNSQNSSTTFGATRGPIFGVQPPQSGSGTSALSQSSTSQPSSFSSSATLMSNSSSWPPSSTFGLNSSSLGFGQITNQTAKSFGSNSAFTFTSGTSNNSTSGLSFSSSPAVSSSPFSFIASASNSSSGLSFSTGSISSSGFPFSSSASSSSSAGNSFSPATTSGLLSSNSMGSTSSVSNFVFGSSPSTGFSFGLTTSASSVTPFSFGSSSGSVFSFTTSGASMSAATSTPAFGMPNTSGGFRSASPNSDQMNVEDTMADDTNQASGHVFPGFGQSNSTPAPSNFLFGSAVPPVGASAFQFGSQQNAPVQNQNPFQPGSNLEFPPGGGFSLGSGGGDKTSRKFVKVRREKGRRK